MADDAAGPPEETLFERASAQEDEGEKLLLDLGAYEGPLDVLLELARAQKVDLREISILELAEQYLVFINAVKRKRLDIAAEYLVMAAWLAYLKSRLLLPKPPEDDEPTGAEMAAHLAFQLERLEAMRSVAEALFARPQLGAEMFARGEPERRTIATRVEWFATQHELLMAYARQRTKESYAPLHLERRAVVAIDEALLRLRAALGESVDWMPLESFLPTEWRDESHARSAIASTFAAALELTKHGRAQIRQESVFGQILIQTRVAPQATESGANPLRARIEAAQEAAQNDAAADEAGAQEPPRRDGARPEAGPPKRGSAA